MPAVSSWAAKPSERSTEVVPTSTGRPDLCMCRISCTTAFHLYSSVANTTSFASSRFVGCSEATNSCQLQQLGPETNKQYHLGCVDVRIPRVLFCSCCVHALCMPVSAEVLATLYLVGGHHSDSQVVGGRKLCRLCGRCACHARQLGVAAEEVLQCHNAQVSGG